MHKLTQIILDNGKMALYFDGYYVGSEDNSGDKMSLSDIATSLLKVPSVCRQVAYRTCPMQEDWCWNDVAAPVLSFPDRIGAHDSMTVEAFMARLSDHPADALCCGTFWLTEDFLEVDESLTTDEIHLAMEIAQHSHDANNGYNWEYLRWAAEQAKN
ncbi:hypothetical protein [Yersinia ruckeri]|uniref:hypothetical protein n=1 Tax=Yersinia ruckeri TaxID=29486 RepID=UPI000F8F72A5|nr:hypothetical protein [Yersinia ruckeri]MCK8540605.1 hypothetical protein [Yersinia ruckeri]MCK8572662.1 hypothetical protein [Yersinia ruckeri]MCK8576105.1 hypothetical protein [Yersinia ruckeri]MCK8578900.1 hypothetical protein [Yersinia ruckeri]MCK8582651.1 hypothetical protein [Yersinia ruckeri]